MSQQTHFFFPIDNMARTLDCLNTMKKACRDALAHPGNPWPEWAKSLNLEYLESAFYDVKVVRTNKGPAISVVLPFIIDTACLGTILHKLFELEPGGPVGWCIPISFQSEGVNLVITKEGHSVHPENFDLKHTTTGYPLEDITESAICERNITDFPFSAIPAVVGIHGPANTNKTALAFHLARKYGRGAKLAHLCIDGYPDPTRITGSAMALYDGEMTHKSLLQYLSVIASNNKPTIVIIDSLNELYDKSKSAIVNAKMTSKLLANLKRFSDETQLKFILIKHDKADYVEKSMPTYLDWSIRTLSATQSDVTFQLKTKSGTEFSPITLSV